MTEKLDSHIPQFRIGDATKKALLFKAGKEKRKLHEYIRIHLEYLAEGRVVIKEPT